MNTANTTMTGTKAPYGILIDIVFSSWMQGASAKDLSQYRLDAERVKFYSELAELSKRDEHIEPALRCYCEEHGVHEPHGDLIRDFLASFLGVISKEDHIMGMLHAMMSEDNAWAIEMLDLKDFERTFYEGKFFEKGPYLFLNT